VSAIQAKVHWQPPAMSNTGYSIHED